MFTQITSAPQPQSSIFRVLVAGFAVVIVLLLAASAIAVNSARSVKESAASLVDEQLTTTRLMQEVESEQEALNAVFYKLSRGPDQVDRERVLQELDDADTHIARILDEAAGRPQEALWRDLRKATLSFSAEARRLLSEKRVTSYSSRNLFHRHEEVTAVITKLVAGGYQRAVSAQAEIERRSTRLVSESLLLLGAVPLSGAVVFLAHSPNRGTITSQDGMAER